jgi:hypothetical protein
MHALPFGARAARTLAFAFAALASSISNFGCAFSADAPASMEATLESIEGSSESGVTTATVPPFSTSRVPGRVPQTNATTIHAMPSGQGSVVGAIRYRAQGTSYVVHRISATGKLLWTWEGRPSTPQPFVGALGGIVAASNGTVFVQGSHRLFAVKADGSGLLWSVATEAFWGDRVGLAYDASDRTILCVFRHEDGRALLQRRSEVDGRLLAERADLFTVDVGVGAPVDAALTAERRIAIASGNQVFLFEPDFRLRAKSQPLTLSGFLQDRQGSIAYSTKDATIVATFSARDLGGVGTPRAGEDVLWKLASTDLATVWIHRRVPRQPGIAFSLSVSAIPDGRLVLGGPVFQQTREGSSAIGVQFELRDENGAFLARRLFPREGASDTRAIGALNRGVYLLSADPNNADTIVRRFQL